MIREINDWQSLTREEIIYLQDILAKLPAVIDAAKYVYEQNTEAYGLHNLAKALDALDQDAALKDEP